MTKKLSESEKIGYHKINLEALEKGRKKYLTKVSIWKERCAEIAKYDSVKTFFIRLNENRRPSPNTTFSYLKDLWVFCNSVKMNPDQLIEERAKSLELKIMDKARQVAEDRLRRYYQEQLEKGASQVAAAHVAVAMSSFYKKHMMPLSMKLPTYEAQKINEAPTSNDVLRLIEATKNIRDKALIAFLWSTGLRESSVAQLTIADYEEYADKKPHLIFVSSSKLKGKKGLGTICFLTDEVEKLMTQYLATRINAKPDEPLFAYSDIERYGAKPLDKASVGFVVRRACKRVYNNPKRFSAHDFRRAFQSKCESSGLNENLIKRFMGHAFTTNQKAYSIHDFDEFRKLFAEKIEPALKLGEREILTTLEHQQQQIKEQDQKIESLEQQLAAMRGEIAKAIHGLEKKS
ncbi:site-specific integrase [Candidatus Bathyarchaeota archaeon]|nr:site-specific integrase [Candidatus Bathyarchaeota archaeon]